VCPGDLIYHFFDNSVEGAGAAGGHRRKMLAASTEANDDDAHDDSDDHNDGWADADHSSNTHLALGSDIRFKLKMHSGDIFYTVAHLHPALKMVPPYRHIDYEDHLHGVHYTPVDICNIEEGLQYLVIKGGDTCAEYEVELLEVDDGVGAHGGALAVRSKALCVMCQAPC
jgi:hypothetical protein